MDGSALRIPIYFRVEGLHTFHLVVVVLSSRSAGASRQCWGSFFSMSMRKYITNCLDIVSGMIGIPVDTFTPCATPMTQQIDATSPPLDEQMSKNFYTMCGFIGWLQLTMKVDVSMLYSRCTQHLKAPNESALATWIRGFRYLKATINLCIAAP